MAPFQQPQRTRVEQLAFKATTWIGSTSSIVLHTLLFLAFFLLAMLGVGLDKILLVLTTAVSLEAIYLAIFIQMTVNRHTQSLEGVEVGIDEIQEDVEGLEKNIDDIQEDLVELQEDDAQDDLEDAKTKMTLEKIELGLQKLMADIEQLKRQG